MYSCARPGPAMATNRAAVKIFFCMLEMMF